MTLIKNRPTILVLMATYNSEKYIREQLDSIINQKFVDVRILISDDHSSDATPSIINYYENKFYNIKILNNNIKFGSPSKNFYNLIIHADLNNIDYVSLSDHDDIWYLDKLSRACDLLKKENCDGYSSSVISFWPSGRKLLLKQYKKIKNFDFIFEGAGQGCTFVIDCNKFKSIQSFVIKNIYIINNFYYHDWLIYLIIRCSFGRWYFDDMPSMLYRQHSQNNTGSRGTYSAVLKRISLLKNGWYKNQIKIAYNIVLNIENSRSNIKYNKFLKIFNASDSLKRRVILPFLIIKNGRRKFTDNLILQISIIFGWI